MQSMLLGICLALLVILLVSMGILIGLQKIHLMSVILELQKEKRDLLNRLMSKDLHSYTAMTVMSQQDGSQPHSKSLGLTSDYISMSDQAVANRLSPNQDDLDEQSELWHDLGLGNRP